MSVGAQPFLPVLLVFQALCTFAAVNGSLKVTRNLIFDSDGDDGWWSTFEIRVGSPGQTVRLLPGTSASAGATTWVIVPDGCSIGNPTLKNCTARRGNTFTRNESSTWSTDRLENGGLYSLVAYEESYLELTGNAYYGFDNIDLGLSAAGIQTLQNQTIAGIGTNNYWLGSLGLSPWPFNFTNFNEPVPSLLSNLRTAKHLPSLSWGYTAGAYYHDPPTIGSLTLGGYDVARLDEATALHGVPFNADFTRDLTIYLESIRYDTLGSNALLVGGIYIFIDSMVTHLWLPTSVCSAFERAFNLTWNSTAQLYLIDEAVHSALLAQDPVFTFTIAANEQSNESVDINIPYQAFDLNVTQPLVDSTSRYFPLKRAQNDTQYTLGRVFLQEAYVIADYERYNFSVAQAKVPDTGVSPNLVTISPPTSDDGSSVDLGDGGQQKQRLSSGAISGIVIGAVVLVALVALACFALLRAPRRRRQRALDVPAEAKHTQDQKSSLLDNDRPEADSRQRYELDYANEFRPELTAESNVSRSNDGGTTKMGHRRHASESSTEDVSAVELDASR